MGFGDELMDDEITRFVRASVADELGLVPEDIGPDLDFEELGMTSLNAVLISGVIEERFAIEVDPSLLFENRTLARASAALTTLIESDRG